MEITGKGRGTDAHHLGYISRILVSLRVLMTKHHHFSGQIILYGAFEEIIKETLPLNFCFFALDSR